jgi:hypothetical protein
MTTRRAVLVGIDIYPGGKKPRVCARWNAWAMAQHLKKIFDYDKANVSVLAEGEDQSGPYYAK